MGLPPNGLIRSFQSAPAIAGGRCSFRQSQVRPIMLVSIRARHCWRAMPWCAMTSAACQRLFQSAPAIAGGRCTTRTTISAINQGFNPRPPLLAGDARWRTS